MTPLKLCLPLWVAWLGMCVHPLTNPEAGRLGHAGRLRPSRNYGQRGHLAQLQGSEFVYLWEVGTGESVNTSRRLWTPGRKGNAWTESPLRAGNRTASLTNHKPNHQESPRFHPSFPWSFPSSLNTLLPKFFSGPLPTSATTPTDWGSHFRPWLSFPEPLSLSAYWQPTTSIPGTLFWQTSSTFPSKSHMTIQSHGILLNAPFSPYFGVCDPNHNFPPFLWLTLAAFTDSSALWKKCWSVSGLSSCSYFSVIPGSRGLWVCTTSALMAHMGKYTQPPWDIWLPQAS